jgi:hypothetical protein
MPHSLERIYIDKLRTCLASYDRGTLKSKFFRAFSILSSSFLIPWMDFQIQHCAGNYCFDVSIQFLKNAAQFIISHIGVCQGNAT